MKLKELKKYVGHKVVVTAILHDRTKEKTKGVLSIYKGRVFIVLPTVERTPLFTLTFQYEYRPEQIVDIQLIK
jgi:hypothetical protein